MSMSFNAESSRNKGVKLLLFLISPFISLLYSIKTLNTRSSYIVLFLFCLCFGMAFTVESQYTEYKGDGVFYRQLFESYQHVTTGEFIDTLKEYLEFSDGNQDFYADTIAFIVSRFTTNYHYFFLVLAIIFAYFQIKCLIFFTSNPKYKFSVITLILLFLFTWNCIFNINGCRFWTAAWIGVYAFLQIFINNKYSYILLGLITPFFHGAFWLYVFILLVGLLFKGFQIVWILLFLLSFVFSSLVVEFVQESADYLPTFLARKVYYYADEFYIQSAANPKGSGFYWMDIIFPKLVNVYTNFLTVMLIINRQDLKDTRYYSLYQFFVVWVTFSNFFMSIPSVGSRMIVLSYPLMALLVLEIYNKVPIIKLFIYVLPFVWFMNIYHLFQNTMSVLDTSFFISSPLIMVVKYLL